MEIAEVLGFEREDLHGEAAISTSESDSGLMAES